MEPFLLIMFSRKGSIFFQATPALRRIARRFSVCRRREREEKGLFLPARIGRPLAWWFSDEFFPWCEANYGRKGVISTEAGAEASAASMEEVEPLAARCVQLAANGFAS